MLAAEFAIDLEPQEGQLDGDVAVETLVADRLDEVDVKPGALDCEFPAVDLLAEERQGPSQSPAVQAAGTGERIVRLVAGHVGRRHPTHEGRRQQWQGAADETREDRHGLTSGGGTGNARYRLSSCRRTCSCAW